MKIDTALILCAGYGERLKPLTLSTPKPLLELNNVTMLENCINVIIKSGIKKILINTHHLSKKFFDFLDQKKFPIDIQIIKDGNKILNTGGGILNMINHFTDSDFLIFNPDTLWSEEYVVEINKMEKFYFSNKLNNILLVCKKELSFDQSLKGDFELKEKFLKKDDKKDFIYIGCQILSKKLFKNYEIKNFSISEIWNELLKKDELNGFESFNEFYHLTNLKTFKKLEDS
jgi:N-acetyl-alpha-D-muramate 1-phosphate uridylyltransferase